MILNIQAVSLHFPERCILKDINYQVHKNDFVIVLGSNGSGKSSLLKLLDGRYQATTGKIEKKSHRVTSLTQNADESLFASLTVFENYLLVASEKQPSAKARRKFFADYISEYNPNLTTKLDQTVEKLSGGEKQALVLGLAMLNPPDILLLDEHTSALDPKSAEHLMNLTQIMLTRYNITCLLTTHDLAIAERFGNRILALQYGVVHQTIEALQKKNLKQKDILMSCY